LCWLAPLLIRITETTTGSTWPSLRRELGQIALGTFTGPAGTFRQRTELTKNRRDILAQLKIEPPAPDPPAHHRNALTSTNTWP
jgi:hypothetical protein